MHSPWPLRAGGSPSGAGSLAAGVLSRTSSVSPTGRPVLPSHTSIW